jgi:GMP synthase-like glutamine amidotransferase
MRPIVVFQFNPTEGPAYFADWLDASALSWRLCAIDRGDSLPDDPHEFAGIGMMGGPMSVTESLPWIEPLSVFLRNAVAEEVPVIGHCLGGQLLAQALGAQVTRTRVPEIGWLDVASVDASARAEWFGGLERFVAFQWHYDIFDLPKGATRVLANDFNPNQAYVIDGRHIGFQCHIEMTRELVETWCRTGADELPPKSLPARQSRKDILDDVDAKVATLNAIADGIYARWSQGLRR